MRSIKEILANEKFQADKKNDFAFEDLVLTGFLHLPGIKKSLQCVVGVELDQDGNQWEHVSVKFCGTTNKTLSWEVMCQVKDVFWLPEEEVHQIHPKASEYLHGVGRIYDILHLYRPVGGWKQNPNRGNANE